MRCARVELPSLKAGVRKPTRTPISFVLGVDRRFSSKAALCPHKELLATRGTYLLLLLLYYRRISSIRGPETYAGGASPAALTHSGVLFPYRQEHSQLSSKVASVVAIEP